MNKHIIIQLNLFSAEHPVYVLSDEEGAESLGSYSVEALPEFITKFAHDSDIYTVKIVGNSKYAPLVEYGIHSLEATKYSKNNIEIEVI